MIPYRSGISSYILHLPLYIGVWLNHAAGNGSSDLLHIFFSAAGVGISHKKAAENRQPDITAGFDRLAGYINGRSGKERSAVRLGRDEGLRSDLEIGQ